MRVAYIFMQFPLPSQAFAVVDVRQLVVAGARVRCCSLRSAHADAAAILSQRGLDEIECSSATWRDQLRGLAYALRHPLTALGLTWRAFVWGMPAPRHVLAGFAVVPRALAIAAELETWRPDVVHLFWGHYPCLVGWLVRRRLPNAALSLFLGAYDLIHHYRGSSALAHMADVVLTHAEVNRRDLASVGINADRVQVIHRGLDPLMVRRPLVEKVSGRVVVASRLTIPKGVEMSIRACAVARTRHPNMHLRILGDGPDRKRLEEIARALGVSDAVTFVGHVPHRQVFEEMDAAEAVLLLSASPSERLPNAVKEAMACGCVVLTTRTPGIEELVDDGVTGLLFDSGDGVVVGEALARVLADPTLREQMAVAARACIIAGFDASHAIGKQLAFWRLAVESRNEGSK